MVFYHANVVSGSASQAFAPCGFQARVAVVRINQHPARWRLRRRYRTMVVVVAVVAVVVVVLALAYMAAAVG